MLKINQFLNIDLVVLFVIIFLVFITHLTVWVKQNISSLLYFIKNNFFTLPVFQLHHYILTLIIAILYLDLMCFGFCESITEIEKTNYSNLSSTNKPIYLDLNKTNQFIGDMYYFYKELLWILGTDRIFSTYGIDYDIDYFFLNDHFNKISSFYIQNSYLQQNSLFLLNNINHGSMSISKYLINLDELVLDLSVATLYWSNEPSFKFYIPYPFIASGNFHYHDYWWLHISVYYYWLWFFFIYLIIFFLITVMWEIDYNITKNNPQRETRGVSRPKCGDLITSMVPVSWASAIIIHESTDSIDHFDGFGTLDFVVGIRAFQWGWEYYYPNNLKINYTMSNGKNILLGNDNLINNDSDEFIMSKYTKRLLTGKNKSINILPLYLITNADSNKIYSEINRTGSSDFSKLCIYTAYKFTLKNKAINYKNILNSRRYMSSYSIQKFITGYSGNVGCSKRTTTPNYCLDIKPKTIMKQNTIIDNIGTIFNWLLCFIFRGPRAGECESEYNPISGAFLTQSVGWNILVLNELYLKRSSGLLALNRFYFEIPSSVGTVYQFFIIKPWPTTLYNESTFRYYFRIRDEYILPVENKKSEEKSLRALTYEWEDIRYRVHMIRQGLQTTRSKYVKDELKKRYDEQSHQLEDMRQRIGICKQEIRNIKKEILNINTALCPNFSNLFITIKTVYPEKITDPIRYVVDFYNSDTKNFVESFNALKYIPVKPSNSEDNKIKQKIEPKLDYIRPSINNIDKVNFFNYFNNRQDNVQPLHRLLLISYRNNSDIIINLPRWDSFWDKLFNYCILCPKFFNSSINRINKQPYLLKATPHTDPSLVEFLYYKREQIKLNEFWINLNKYNPRLRTKTRVYDYMYKNTYQSQWFNDDQNTIYRSGVSYYDINVLFRSESSLRDLTFNFCSKTGSHKIDGLTIYGINSDITVLNPTYTNKLDHQSWSKTKYLQSHSLLNKELSKFLVPYSIFFGSTDQTITKLGTEYVIVSTAPVSIY